jgi:extracellular elastinolytic metalloproteinase
LSNPAEGERVIETDPFLEEASEFGWHSTGTEEFDTTWGNNAIAHLWRDSDSEEDYENKPRPSDPDLNFQYPYSPEEEDWEGYGNASVTQLFYTTNKYHDLLYLLGFTEAAGNFEANNNGAGGQGNDMVLLDAQDTTSKNNGAFATPPDGSPGRITLYMFDRNGLPERDPSFDAAVVIHEYTHGVSNRLTGGPANAQCLSLPEARGMGEGWSDFMAIALRLKVGDTRDTDYPLGDWVSKDPLGIRRYLYSTDMTTNPHVYEDLDLLLIVEHAMGTVWATMLYEVLWNLIDKHGKNDNPVPEFDSNGVPTDGKYLTMKLVLDGMKLQPCNPTFPVARDAILDADLVLSGGDNACQIWSGFAKRGLGEGAVYDFWNRTQSFDIPEGVC